MDLSSIVAAVVIIVVWILLMRSMGRYLLLTYFKERSRFDAFFGPIERCCFEHSASIRMRG